MFKRLFTVAALVALLASPVFAQSDGFIRLLKDSAGASMSGLVKTATFDSEAVNLQGWATFCLAMDIDWTAGTIDIDVEFSLDGGTTWFESLPITLNSETGADMTQIGADAKVIKCWRNPFPVIAGFSTAAAAITPRVRFEFTLASSPNVSFTNAYIVASESP